MQAADEVLNECVLLDMCMATLRTLMPRTHGNRKVFPSHARETRAFLGQPVDVNSECRKDGPKLSLPGCLEPDTALYRDLLVS